MNRGPAPAFRQAPAAAGASAPATADFDQALRRSGCGPLRRGRVTTLQVNVGKLCNQACHHCHVDAGPKRTERMDRRVAARVVELLERSPSIETVDITGGAPELNEQFRYLVLAARRLGRRVMDRCNLTVLLEPGQEDLAEFLALHAVEITASLPCYTAANVDRQRGRGVFDKSLQALRILNGLGYGKPASGRLLNLVYNPVGPSLPPPQSALERDYRQRLHEDFGIEFNRLFTLTNMPIQRFAAALAQSGQAEVYMALLVNHFNPATVAELMCRSLVSVSWDGRLYDCDFNQMLGLEALASADGCTHASDLWSIASFADLDRRRIATGPHCFGCTAGAGSSCGGSLR